MKTVKLRIYPNDAQKVLIEKHFGCCRWIYNYGLEKKTKFYNETKKSLSIFDISGDLPKLKGKEETAWLKEVGSQTLQQALKDLDSAFSMFFKKATKFPRFKSKRNNKQSFRVPQGFEVIPAKHVIDLPKIGIIKFRDKFEFPDDISYRSITVSKNSANQYFASVLLDDKTVSKVKQTVHKSKTLGIDLGVKTFATFSDGQKVENPKFLKESLDKIKTESEKLSRKTKDSNNYGKQKLKLAKTHLKVANQRQDFLNKLTTSISKNQGYTSIAIEDLAVKDMAQTFKPINRAIGDCGFRIFRTMLEYKCEREGKNLLVINRFDASSKTCSCGVKNETLSLDERTWICQSCGVTHDRDLLAANNIKTFAVAGQATRFT